MGIVGYRMLVMPQRDITPEMTVRAETLSVISPPA